MELFAEDSAEENPTPTITHEQYLDLLEYLRKKKNPAILPIQIAYYTGLRIGDEHVIIRLKLGKPSKYAGLS